MAVYPAALPTIPDDGTWNHSQVGDEIEAIALELGTNPSAAFTDVTARFTAAEARITTVEGATTTAGVEIGAATITTDWDIKNQSGGNQTWTDVTGLSIAVAAQTRAYDILFSCTFVATVNSSFVGPKMTGVNIRICDSAATTVVETSQIPIIFPVSGALTLFAKGYFMGRVAAGQGATTWKLQTRTNATPDTNMTAVAIFAGTDAANTGVTRRPALLQAVTV